MLPAPPAFEELQARAVRLGDLYRISMFLSWDQSVMMPPAGAAVRAEHRGTIEQIRHELLVAPETGRLLEELVPYEDSLDRDSNEASLIRYLRREHEKQVRVPAELRAAFAREGVLGRRAWQEAKERSDFSIFRPALERNVELRQLYVDCFDDYDERYDTLLDEFEPGMKTAEVRAVFEELKAEVVPLVDALRGSGADDSFLRGTFPLDRQQRICREVVDLFGHRSEAWRLDHTAHPFASSVGRDDIRVTTHWREDDLDALFSTMHEYGHGIYEHQVAPELERTPLGRGTSLGLHESQSRMWENLVGRSLPFWRLFYPRLRETFPEQLGDVDLDGFYRGINRVEPSLIRIRADEVTYGLHVILRFELEQDMIEGRVDLRELPDAWNAKIEEYLGLEVPDDARGVLQDMHWGVGHIGYFSTYLLGSIISVQIWERMGEDLQLDDLLERGEFGPVREWLGETIHRHGRKFLSAELLQRAVGGPIDVKPYVRYLREKTAALAAS